MTTNGHLVRTYPNDPDWDYIEQDYATERAGVERMRTHVDERRFVADPLWIGHFSQVAGWALGYGWALGRPIEELREVVRPAIEGLHAGLAAGIDPDSRRLSYPLMVSVIVGDRHGATETARLRTNLAVGPAPNDTVEQTDLIVAALTLDDTDAARDHADTVTAHLDRLETPPDIARAVHGYDRMARAILNRDQQGLDSAAADRAATVAEDFSGSIEARRNIFGVFDFSGVALCRFAHAAGMDLPDQPIFAADLIRHI